MTPNKHKNRNSAIALDDFDRAVLRRTIINYHVTKKCVPTSKGILQKFSDDTGYQGSIESLRKEIRKLGFRWRKFKNNRKVLMERQPVRLLRIEFLKKMRTYRQEGRPIIYMDETYVHSTHTHEKGWNDETTDGLQKPVSKGSRLIIVNAGGEDGFVKNAYIRWKSTSNSGDYHNEMNYELYKKWATEKLIPNLPPKSVVVIDNAPYHNKQKEKMPVSSTKKEDMKQWLRLRNIPFGEQMLKPELYNIIKNHKPRYKCFEIDELFIAKGHSVLRLPPYHPDLNPIELVWAALKVYVAKKNVSFSFENVAKYCDEFFEQFTVEEWKSRCNRAIRFENEFMENEPMMDIIVENLIINLSVNSDSESDSQDDSDNSILLCQPSDNDDDLSGIEELPEESEDDSFNQPSVSRIGGKTFTNL